MPVWEFSALTWEAVARVDRSRAVAILPTGALEAHGPHLPLETDVIIASAMARAGAGRLSSRGLDVLILPPVVYTPAPFANNFPGTVSISPELLTRLVIEIGIGLHGVHTLGIANAHLDPAHLAALHAAHEALSKDPMRCAFPDLTRRELALRLTDEFQSGACHAGRFETSIVLAERPDLVDDAVRRTLPAFDRSLSVAIRAGKKTFEEVGGDRAYFGDPAAASTAEGAASIEELGRILEEAVVEVLGA